MQFLYSALTDVGRHRQNNEDAVRVDAARQMAVLADGMGGYSAGEVASALAVDIIAQEMERVLRPEQPPLSVRDLCRAMEVCVDRANLSIYNAAQANPAYAGMGTTLVMSVLQGNALIVGHAGDSRAYRLRAGEFQQLTRDHSLLQEQIDAGFISPEEASVSPIRNYVTRALGVEDTVLLEVHAFTAMPGDVYLLCSDGLTDMVDDRQIAKVMGQNTVVEQRAQRLVDLANDQGGVDNISVILFQTGEMSKKSGFMSKLRG